MKNLLCEDCEWIGKQGDCIKVYTGIFGTEGDVEPHLQCPKCGSENLIELSNDYVRPEPVLV